ncbi:hypothetical protein BKE38_14490 [Pseudoroseomonas deserti]|uniref:Secreted protein n=1 Tax=Teichococcus deserti TaxID=1817963 RepID=A0A1V2H2Y9_9PROT|nr:hypothetical protein [Pseudoroseomonas deserti]ONG52447.1 hypothetical protein BKE38_14490 [Pseudoroseomonas deserti]
MRHRCIPLLLLGGCTLLAGALMGAPEALPASAGECRFETLSAEDQRRYRSRYNRRLRNDGRAVAERWLRDQACSTPEERAARRAPRGRDGRPCTRTRVEMRVTPGFGGEAMSMAPVTVCAD